MFVRLWMTRNPVCVEPAMPIEEARVLMEDNEFRRLPVVEEGKLRGLLCESDVRTLPAIHAGDPVEEIMVPEVETVSPFTPIEEAVRRMYEKKIGCLVVTYHEEVQGILTDTDAFRAFMSILEAGEPSVRLTFDMQDDGHGLHELSDLIEGYGLEVDSLVVHRRRADPGRKIVGIRVRGRRVEAFVDSLWKGGYRVLQVLIPEEEESEAPVDPRGA